LAEEVSRLNVEVSDEFEDGKFYGLAGDVQLAFKPEVLGPSHVFRLKFHVSVFCDRLFEDAVGQAGNVTATYFNGLWFYDGVSS